MQVLIRWAIQNGTSVIPKATGVSHIQGNLDALNFELTQQEFQVDPTLAAHSALSAAWGHDCTLQSQPLSSLPDAPE